MPNDRLAKAGFARLENVVPRAFRGHPKRLNELSALVPQPAARGATTGRPAASAGPPVRIRGDGSADAWPGVAANASFANRPSSNTAVADPAAESGDGSRDRSA